MLMYRRTFRFLDCLIRWRFTLRASLWLLLPLVVAPCLALAREPYIEWVARLIDAQQPDC